MLGFELDFVGRGFRLGRTPLDTGVHDRSYEGGALSARVKIATAEQQAAVAAYGRTVLVAFGEAETALTNEGLLTQRLEFDQPALSDRMEAVRISRM